MCHVVDVNLELGAHSRLTSATQHIKSSSSQNYGHW